MCVVANPKRPQQANRNLGQRIRSAPVVARTGCRTMKQKASPAARRFTARTSEDRSANRAGMDGVPFPKPVMQLKTEVGCRLLVTWLEISKLFAG